MQGKLEDLTLRLRAWQLGVKNLSPFTGRGKHRAGVAQSKRPQFLLRRRLNKSRDNLQREFATDFFRHEV